MGLAGLAGVTVFARARLPATADGGLVIEEVFALVRRTADEEDSLMQLRRRTMW